MSYIVIAHRADGRHQVTFTDNPPVAAPNRTIYCRLDLPSALESMKISGLPGVEGSRTTLASRHEAGGILM